MLHPHVGLAALAFIEMLRRLTSHVYTIGEAVFTLADSVLPYVPSLTEDTPPKVIAVMTCVVDSITAVIAADGTGDMLKKLSKKQLKRIASLTIIEGPQRDAALRCCAAVLYSLSRNPSVSISNIDDVTLCIVNVLYARRAVAGGEGRQQGRSSAGTQKGDGEESSTGSGQEQRPKHAKRVLNVSLIDISGMVGTIEQPLQEQDAFESALVALVDCASCAWNPNSSKALQGLFNALENNAAWLRQYSAAWRLMHRLQELLIDRSKDSVLVVELARYVDNICLTLPDEAEIVLRFIASLTPLNTNQKTMILSDILRFVGPWFSFCCRDGNRSALSGAMQQLLSRPAFCDANEVTVHAILGWSLTLHALGSNSALSHLEAIEYVMQVRSQESILSKKKQEQTTDESADASSDYTATVNLKSTASGEAVENWEHSGLSDEELQCVFAHCARPFVHSLLSELLRLSTSVVSSTRRKACQLYCKGFAPSTMLVPSQWRFAFTAFYAQIFGPIDSVESLKESDTMLQVRLTAPPNK